MRSLRFIAACLLVAIAASVAIIGEVYAGDQAEACDDVLVVVDTGNAVDVQCVVAPTSGLDALRSAGHDYTFVPGVPGFVCTISGTPDPCNRAPVTAYWSYWQAEAGHGWTCATQGAATTSPEAGTAEGWRFGDGSTPPSVHLGAPAQSVCHGQSSAASASGGLSTTMAILAASVVILTVGAVVAIRRGQR